MLTQIFIQALRVMLILTLPFILLIRGSVYIHENYDPGAYPSLLAGIIMTALLILLYILVLDSYISRKLNTGNGLRQKSVFALLMVSGYCIHGLFFLSVRNVQSPVLKKEMTDLHPLVRVAVSTVIFVDKDLIITDASRTPEDYRRMGLRTNSSSLHYKQEDNYAYAMDLRTSKHSEIRNFFLQNYFRLMGFNTLRHVGTADHLHISLPCHYRPGSI